MVQVEAQWFQEAKRLSERLREAYTNASFCRMSLLEVSSSLATDHLLGCDLSLASKHVSSPVQEPMDEVKYGHHVGRLMQRHHGNHLTNKKHSPSHPRKIEEE